MKVLSKNNKVLLAGGNVGASASSSNVGSRLVYRHV